MGLKKLIVIYVATILKKIKHCATRGATGGLLQGNKPFICGGGDKKEDAIMHCFIGNVKQWNQPLGGALC